MRHNAARNLVGRFAASGGFNPELEKPGLLQPRPLMGSTAEDGSRVASDADDQGDEGRRPADVYIPNWHLGGAAALDLAVTSGLRSDVLVASASDGNAAAVAYESTKRLHLDTARHCTHQL